MEDDEWQPIRFAISGALRTISWDGAIARLDRANHMYRFTVDIHTNFLVVGMNPSEEKLQDADTYGVSMISEERFLEMTKPQQTPENH